MMDFQDIITLVNMALVGIACYFLKQTMDRLKVTEENSLENTKQIGLVKQENDLKHSFNAKELKSLETAVKDLTTEIKDLNTELRSRQ